MANSYSTGQMELLLAVERGTFKCVAETIELVGLKKDKSWFDYTLIVAALKRGHKTIINFLLKNDCRVRRSTKTNDYHTPLYYAVMLGDICIVRKLLKHGASINDKDLNEETPLILAIRTTRFYIADLMLQKVQQFENMDPANKDHVLHFHIACLRDNLNVIKKFMSQGFSVNSHSDLDKERYHGFTPLHFAVKNASYETFRFLLKHDPDLSIKCNEGLTPLHCAFYSSSTFTKCMIDEAFTVYKKEFVKSIDKNGISHFHICCTRDIPQAIEMFLNNGVDINSPVSLDSNVLPGYTPLHFAVKNNRVEVIKVLLRNNANTVVKSKEGSTPLHLACQHGHIQIIELLLKSGVDTAATDDKGNTPLHCAFYAHAKNEALINLLLSQIPKDVNYIDAQGISHFHIACTRNADLVKSFLDHGVLVNLCANSHEGIFSCYSALHFAIHFNNESVVQLLLQHNANVNNNNNDLKMTPIHLACKYSSFKFHKLITINKDDYKNIDWSFNRKAQIEIIELLLNYKADINAKDWAGNTPLVYACKLIIENIIDIPYNLELKRVILNEMYSRQKEIISVLLCHNADIHVSTYSNASILHIISELNGNDETVELAEFLLKKGANIHFVDAVGFTPLHVAMNSSNKELVKTFLHYNANVNAKTNNLLTPLHMSMESIVNHYLRDKDISELLLQKGAEVNAQDLAGNTPLHIACQKRNFDAIQLLLEYGADINVENLQGYPTIFPIVKYFTENYSFYSLENVMLKLIDVHIKKLIALSFPISCKVEEYYIKLQNDNKKDNLFFVHFDSTYIKCTEELNRMKQIKIDNYSSVFNILFKNENEMAKHVKNERLQTILNTSMDDFPLYNYLLKLQFTRGLARSKILKPAKDSLEFVIGISLPDSCSELILKYLTNENLDSLVKAENKINNHKRKLNIDSTENNRPTVKQQRLE